MVVVASGHVAHRYIPQVLAPLAPGLPGAAFSHTCTPSDLTRLAGRTVAIIGGGQSALESAALLHEAGAEVVVVAREPRLEWIPRPEPVAQFGLGRMLKPGSPLGPGWTHKLVTDAPDLVRRLPAAARLKLVEQVRGPSGAWWLRDRVEGCLDVRLGTSVTRVDALDDGRVLLECVDPMAELNYLVVDHVIAATGYRVDLANFDFLDDTLLASIERVPGSGSPALDASFESSVPGLFFTGLPAAATFGPVLRFVCGTDFAGPRIATSGRPERQRHSIRPVPTRRPSRSAS